MTPLPISGHTRPYAVLGHPIAHSLSPAMHNASLRALGLDAVYLAFDVHPDRLMAVLPAMRDMGFGGVNLTVPLKEVAAGGLTEQDDSARRLGAVNTVEFLPDGRLKGHNTDGAGFLLAMKESFDTTARGKRIFILGCGGAGRAVALTCATEGAAQLLLADTDSRRPDALAREIDRCAPHCGTVLAGINTDDWARRTAEADWVIQATPVGMKPTDPTLLPSTAFRPKQCVYDLVYMYPETAFMRTAREAGARTANGLGMLLHQGAKAFTIWTGQQANVAAMRSALETAVYGH